jgi:hypothetical protein
MAGGPQAQQHGRMSFGYDYGLGGPAGFQPSAQQVQQQHQQAGPRASGLSPLAPIFAPSVVSPASGAGRG